nr:hypothetical protein [Tanacetum cinerariifolium]
MYDEPMWAADLVVAPTLVSAITVPETAKEFAIKEMDLFAFIRHVDPTKVKALVVDQPKKIKKKRKVTDGAGGFGFPTIKLKEDYGTSGDDGASVAGKYLVAFQGLLERSTLAAKVGVTTAASVPFVTSFVTPTPEHEGGGGGDSVTGPIIHTQPTPRVNPSNFRDSASPTMAEANVAGPSQPVETDLSAGSFYISRDMDAETHRQVYIPKWNIINDSVLDDTDVCRGKQDGLTAGIEHGRAERSIEDVTAFNPSAEGDYVAIINALRDVNFPLLSQLKDNKDSSMADIMDLLRLEGPAAEAFEASQLQPSLE